MHFTQSEKYFMCIFPFHRPTKFNKLSMGNGGGSEKLKIIITLTKSS